MGLTCPALAHEGCQHAPIKKKRVREKDIPYMTQEWKRALRNKRKYAKKFAEDRTSENMELKRKYRNIATRERRKAIRAYWYTKADKHKSRPSKFYDTFKPFISNKIKELEAIYLKTEGDNAVKDQTEVAEILTKYFTNAALSIGGDHVNNIKEEAIVTTAVLRPYEKPTKKPILNSSSSQWLK